MVGDFMSEFADRVIKKVLARPTIIHEEFTSRVAGPD
jgi:hypothetical protein